MSKLTTHTERIAANDKFTEDLKEMMKRPSALALAAMMLSGSADKLVGKQLGKVLIALLLPAVHQARNAEERAKSIDELTDAVIALAAHRAKHGAYPERLSGLDEKPPRDRFSGKALIYRREGEGYWLYNVGPNLRDDAGKGPYTEKSEQVASTCREAH